MLKKIMAMAVSGIIVLTALLSVFTYAAVRDSQIANRLDALTGDARDIAYLASQTRKDVSQLFTLRLVPEDSIMSALRRKAGEVYEKYGAYIMVVDRQGRIMDNMREILTENPMMAEMLDEAEIGETMRIVLQGETVSTRMMIDHSPSFMVGVPFVRRQAVLGAVLIRTDARPIETLDPDLITTIILTAVGMALVISLALFLYVRKAMKPLGELRKAAEQMGRGDFSSRVSLKSETAEITTLAATFNDMADQLGRIESGRREFVANVSHELRSPVTSIAGFVDGMAEGVIPQKDHGKYLQIVSDETHRLSRLIGDLLALSRLEREDAAPEWSDFDINEMLRRAVIRRVSDLETRQMDVDCDFDSDRCYVHADSERIEQVVVNLLDNAIKFTPEGGIITFSTRIEKGICTVTVHNTGERIPDEDRSRLFERFFTADRAHTSGKGTGLGLSICQRILEMHGQVIRLLDTEEGTAFAFTLEAGHEPNGQTAEDKESME